MARLFGTDGVRGVANTELTCELAYRLGQAAVAFLGKAIVVGKDTRLSGDMLESAMVAGITSAGGTALLTGVIPTPAVALLVRELNAAGGAVISASHNPPEYNGIKLFDAEGFKLPDAVEDEIEAFIKQGGLEGRIERAREAGDEDAAMPSGPERRNFNGAAMSERGLSVKELRKDVDKTYRQAPPRRGRIIY